MPTATPTPTPVPVPVPVPVIQRIAFRSDRDGNWEIYVMDKDGSNHTRLTTNSAQDIEPAWSPDGSKTAFTSDRDGDWEVYLVKRTAAG